MQYNEKTFERKREYYLNDHELLIDGKIFLSSDFRKTIPLKDLDPNMERIRFRSQAFQSGMGMAALFFVGAYVVSELFKIDSLTSPVSFLYMFGFCGVLMMLVTSRKIEYVKISNKAGVPVVAIAKAGKKKNEFGHFVGCLKINIENQTKT